MASGVKFVVNEDTWFLNTLGVVWGHIHHEGYHPIPVLTMEKGTMVLDEAVATKILSPKAARRLKAKMLKAGIAADIKEIAEKLKALKLPDDCAASYRFVACSNCSEIPLTHGAFYDDNDQCVSGVITTFVEFLEFAQRLEEHISFLNALALGQQVLAAKVALDERELGNNYEALPSDVRAAFEEYTVEMADNLHRKRVMAAAIVEMFRGTPGEVQVGKVGSSELPN